MMCSCCPSKNAKAVKDNDEGRLDGNRCGKGVQRKEPKVAAVSFEGRRFAASLLAHYFPSLRIHSFNAAVGVLTCDLSSYSACLGLGISVSLDGAGYRHSEFGAIVRLDILGGSADVLEVVDMQVPITSEARLLRDSVLSRPQGRIGSGIEPQASVMMTEIARAQANLDVLLEISAEVNMAGECAHSEDTTSLSSFSTARTVPSRRYGDVWMEDMCHPRYPVVVYNDLMYADSGLGL
jgi:hypothetical protein